MSRNPDQIQVNQDSLIIAHPESGQMLARDFEHEGSVDIVAHRLHQLNVLSLFGAINQREMFYSYQKQVASERYGDNAQQVLEGSKRNRDLMVDEAKDEYYRSQGVFTVIESANDFPDFNLDLYLANIKRLWGIFQAKYRGERHSVARAELSRRLRSGIAFEQSEDNRHQESRPYISKADQQQVKRQDGSEYPLLTSRERLQALQDDPRAGFLPKNDREKIKCFTYLDYLDNPEYPLGVTNQFVEVFIHQQKGNKPNKLDTAQKSVISITHELNDHWQDAVRSVTVLTALEQELDGCFNHRVPLTEDVSQDHPGIPVLVRFRDLEKLRDSGEVPNGIGNPLRAVEDRRPHDDVTKNKTVADVYTATNRSAEMESYITEQAAAMSVQQARKIIKRAIADERAREIFLADRMQDLVDYSPGKRTLPMAALAGRLLTEAQRAS